jgi:hypothetical protein
LVLISSWSLSWFQLQKVNQRSIKQLTKKKANDYFFFLVVV